MIKYLQHLLQVIVRLTPRNRNSTMSIFLFHIDTAAYFLNKFFYLVTNNNNTGNNIFLQLYVISVHIIFQY